MMATLEKDVLEIQLEKPLTRQEFRQYRNLVQEIEQLKETIIRLWARLENPRSMPIHDKIVSGEYEGT